MIVYQANKKKFTEDVFNGTIADEIDLAFNAHLGRGTSPNEKMSWKNSMMYMNNVINTPDIPDEAGIAIEYQIPLASKRIDFMISGSDESLHSNVVIIELKQWEHASLCGKAGLLTTRFQHGESETAHPSYQAWSYAFMLNSYCQAIQDENIHLYPCAYLHNYNADHVITNPCFDDYIKEAPVFLKTDAGKLQNFIKSHIKYGSKHDIIWLIENGQIRPSKQLADSLTSMLKGNQEFVLLDEQKVVYETALSLAQPSLKGKKQVFIVEGGPGTGKSVVAINLLVKFTSNRLLTQYVSKNAAPRDVYTAKLTGIYKKNFISNLFVSSGNFINKPKNFFDVLIVDEAHRLNMKSGFYGTDGENQIKEIINASKYSIFFVDDRQKIHIKDIGSRRSIEKYAEECGATIHTAKLSAQFRCNGSDGYLNWLDNTMQVKETANTILTSEDYDFRIFDDPNELFATIVNKNAENNKSRLVAGYCWDWKSKKIPDEYDIVLPEHRFHKRWNLRSDGNMWILNPESVEEIGCIHTCQGLELDYVGVIVGPDMRFEDGKVITDVFKRSGNDQSIKGFKSRIKEDRAAALQDADEIIKNTYRTLMTRGIKGCYVYFCDKALAEHFSKNLRLTGSQEHTQKSEHRIRIEPTVNDDMKYIDYLPLYSARAACGYFGDGELVETSGWIRADQIGKLNRNMFVVKAVGNSMEPQIHDGDLCIFRANPAGSRQGKIVLAEHNNCYDSDYTGSYSIKTYTSRKSYDSDGNWKHEEIILQPANPEYNPIHITEETADEFRIIGELIGIL